MCRFILNAASNDTWGEVKNAGKCRFYSYNVYQNVSLIAVYSICRQRGIHTPLLA